MDTILVIDDEPGMRKTIRAMLEGAAYRVLEAPDDAAGIKLYQEHVPRLVITDILMLDKDGLETVREIRKLDPKARIIAMSGGGRTARADFLKVAERDGAMDSLKKPFRRNELLAAVERALARLK
jgi:DNA-binding NtrC family response regulator